MAAVKRQKPRAAWKKAEPDSARLDAVLDAAAVEFNAFGISGASLSRIARQVKLGRAALYYYVESRDELAFRCYMRACWTTADDLAAARKTGRKGLDRVQRFIERTLDPQRAPAVVLSEIPYLGQERRALVETAHHRNVQALQQLVRDGIDDRSIRVCDAEIIAQAIVGIVSWAPLAEEWTAGSGETVRRRAAQALSELISDGVAANPDAAFECPLNASDYGFRPGNAFDREVATAMKVEQLTKTASRLFNRRGIDGTSLDQITEALGATKGAFYQYIPDKTALIARCHQRAMDLYENFVEASARHGRNGLERAFIGLHLNVQAQAGELSPLSPLTGLEALPGKMRAPIQKRGLALERRFEKFNHDGIADGSLQPFEVRTVATTGAGVFGWIPKWRKDGDPRTPHAVADEIVALYLRGLRRR